MDSFQDELPSLPQDVLQVGPPMQTRLPRARRAAAGEQDGAFC